MEGKFSTLGNIPHLLHFKVSNYKLQSGNPELKKKGGTKGGTNEKGDLDKTGDLGRKAEKKEGPKPEKKVPWGICGYSVNCLFLSSGAQVFLAFIYFQEKNIRISVYPYFSREVYPYFTLKGSISILLFLWGIHEDLLCVPRDYHQRLECSMNISCAQRLPIP